MKLNRRKLLLAMPAVAALPRAIYSNAAMLPAKKKNLIIGCGTGGRNSKSKGLYTAVWNEATGELGDISVAAEASSPTFFAIEKTQNYLFAVNEGRTGGIVSFRIRRNGKLTLEKINEQPTPGGAVTHISVSHDGKAVFTANYGGGTTTSYKVNADGSLSAPVSHFLTKPVDDDPIHAHPHIHECTPTPDDKWLLVNDLGSDRIWVYALDTATATLTPAATPFWQGRHASGPRHLRFHPLNKSWVYSVNELDSTVDVLSWDSTKGVLTTIDHVSTMEASYGPPSPPNYPSDIVISSDGKYAYVGNRGISPEVLTVFSIDKKTGKLTIMQRPFPPDGVVWARDLTLDPSEKFLLVAGQKSNSFSVIARDKKTGKLADKPQKVYELDSPQCLVFTS